LLIEFGILTKYFKISNASLIVGVPLAIAGVNAGIAVNVVELGGVILTGGVVVAIGGDIVVGLSLDETHMQRLKSASPAAGQSLALQIRQCVHTPRHCSSSQKLQTIGLCLHLQSSS